MLARLIARAASPAAPARRWASKLNVGVIGAGRIGRVHAQCLSVLGNVNIVRVSDPNEEFASDLATQLNTRFTVHEDEVLEDKSIDAVWLCSPSQFHTRQCIKAAQHGKHVFCEKPLATEVADANAADNAARQAGVLLMVGFNRRFDAQFARVRQAVREGKVGQPITAHIISRDLSEPPLEYVRGGGGLFADMSIHDLDMSRFVLDVDEDVGVAVQATGSTMITNELRELDHPSERIDTAVITLMFENGAHAIISNCRRNVSGYDQRVEVFGSDGVVRATNPTPTFVQWMDKHGFNNIDTVFMGMHDRYRESYVEENKHFVECVLENKQPGATGRDGVVALKLAKACDMALEKGRTVSVSEVQ